MVKVNVFSPVQPSRARSTTARNTMTKPSLTERQNSVYEYIRSYIREHQKPPTMAEIGAALSIRSTNGVHKFVVVLERKGYITRTPRVSRGIALSDSDDPFALTEAPPLLPVLGRVRSDQPENLRLHPTGALLVDPRLLGPAHADSCVITVAGDDGMQDLGIRKGDFLIVQETDWSQLLNGELAAALIGERVIARLFDFSRNRYHLRPTARGYKEEAFRPKATGCHVIGRVLGVMRKL